MTSPSNKIKQGAGELLAKRKSCGGQSISIVLSKNLLARKKKARRRDAGILYSKETRASEKKSQATTQSVSCKVSVPWFGRTKKATAGKPSKAQKKATAQ